MVSLNNHMDREGVSHCNHLGHIQQCNTEFKPDESVHTEFDNGCSGFNAVPLCSNEHGEKGPSLNESTCVRPNR